MEKLKEKLFVFYRSHKRMPTYTEMMKLFEYKSKSAVHYAISKLIEKGVISKDVQGRLIPIQNVNRFPSRLLGLVEAGFPSHSEEELIDTISLDEYLIRNPDATFILRVKGDSMIDAGIVEGDLVIVERGKTSKPGDIVIAFIDGGHTMKYLRQKGKQMFLEPANKKYKPLIPVNEFRIEAVVIGIVRTYH